jgi:hypothetical protein
MDVGLFRETQPHGHRDDDKRYSQQKESQQLRLEASLAGAIKDAS